MEVWFDLLPWLITLLLLVACSAFFSASEAALFYLTWKEREGLPGGSRAQRAAATLLENPDRLLSAVLFWNLVINMTYFAIAARIGIDLGNQYPDRTSFPFFFAAGSLLTIIFFSEMLPKSVAVLTAYRLTCLVSLPLSLAVRIVDPIMPGLRFISIVSRVSLADEQHKVFEAAGLCCEHYKHRAGAFDTGETPEEGGRVINFDTTRWQQETDATRRPRRLRSRRPHWGRG